MIFSRGYAFGVLTTTYALPGSSRINPSNASYILPQADPNPSQRAAEVAAEKAGYLYGSSLLGNASFFPAGDLGQKRVAADVALFVKNASYITESIEKEVGPVEQIVTAVSSDLSSESWGMTLTGE